MTEEIKKEPLGLGELLDSFHEFVPGCYTLDTLDEHLLGANNALCTLAEEIMPDLKNEAIALIKEHDCDPVQVIEQTFRNISVWIDVHLRYLEDEAEWTRNEILKKMEYQQECHEASEHFEDYMNVPFPDVYESRVPDPCEIPDYEGNYNCPFDAYGPDDCRRHCGLGVDE